MTVVVFRGGSLDVIENPNFVTSTQEKSGNLIDIM